MAWRSTITRSGLRPHVEARVQEGGDRVEELESDDLVGGDPLLRGRGRAPGRRSQSGAAITVPSSSTCSTAVDEVDAAEVRPRWPAAVVG